MQILRTNVREPNQVVGDFYSLAACNEVGHRRLIDMMDEIGLTLARRARRHSSSRAPAMPCCERIKALPKGRWSNELMTDGYDEPVKLAATVSIAR